MTIGDTRPVALFRYAVSAEGRGRLLGGGASGFAGHQLAEVMVPVVVGVAIDRAIGPGDGTALVLALLLLTGVFALLVASWQTADRMITRVHARGEHALRQRTIGNLLRGARVRRAPGEVLTIASSDAAQVAGFSWVVAEQAGAVAALVASGIVLASISWLLVAGVLLCTLAQVALVHLMSGRLRSRGYEAQRLAARIDALGTDFALGLRALEALGAIEEAGRRYRAESAEAARAAYRADRANTTLSMVNALSAGVAFAAIAAVAGALALAGTISVGSFVIGVGLAQAVRRPLQIIGYLPGSLAAKHGSARRLGELWAQTAGAGQEELARDSAQPHPLDDDRAIVEIAVAGRRIAVASGAIVGIRADDATATALCDLLGARRAPLRGELAVNGDDASLLSADAVRRMLFAPPHEAVLFSGSIRDNLDVDGRGAVEGGDAAVLAAVLASGLDEVVARLPAGLDEAVGDNGGRLSGGQRQRVLMARALRTGQAVLVLHEPTTAVDPVTEAHIARSAAAYLRARGRTAVLITASPALLGVCDEVVSVAALLPEARA